MQVIVPDYVKINLKTRKKALVTTALSLSLSLLGFWRLIHSRRTHMSLSLINIVRDLMCKLCISFLVTMGVVRVCHGAINHF